ncbi:uncharacterized protein LOC111031169 [Myzus persicae]|uniref:uncharacterized protein LOC111031169 n=1 Tax=Myzus persicae TaxID=13164 RepID=UPI000B930F60|nr:uncharacterized protein LOC111031169 [Myzus persicae]
MNSRTECSPRIIKRTTTKEKTDDASKYGFYRQINHLSIVKLDNETDKMNYSSWLTRLDNESSDLKMHLIKILFISLRSDRSFQMFLKPPPDDLKDLELKSDNTMDMVKYLQDNNIVDESLTNEEKKQEIKHKRSAAVATNMRSYTTIKTSPYFVQSFYVRSDWPIYTWYNPTSIQLPTSHDHNLWEKFLNRFKIVTEDKNASSKHRNECDDIIPIDQVSKEVMTAFNWHPYSILGSEENRPKRTAGSIGIDVDVANQQCNQQQIDDAAFAIVYCKVFPGNKVLSQRMYSATLIPDAKFIFKMTGVTLVNYSNLKLKKDETLPFTCKLKQRKRAVKNSCEVKACVTPCEKPMMTIHCGKPQLPSSTIEIQYASQIIQDKTPTNVVSTTNNNESDSKFSNLNKTYQECKSSSKCLKRTPKKTKSVECCKFPKEVDLTVNDNSESKDRKNCSTVLNAGRSSFNDSSNCDWTVSSVEISMREPDQACSSIPSATKASNCNQNCKSMSLDQIERVEPEDQNARQCSDVQQTVATPPHQSPKPTESFQEPPQEHHNRPSLDNREDTNSERTGNDGADKISSSSQRGTPSGQRMSAPEQRDRCASARGLTPNDGRRVGQCPAKDQNHSCPAAFAEHPPSTPKRPDTSGVSYSDRSASQLQQQQQQQQSTGPSSDNNRSDTAAAAAWNPDVSSYSAFSDRHMANDLSRFLTSERTVNDFPAAVMNSRPSSPLSPLLPANDFYAAAAAAAANNDNNLTGDSFGGESDWSGEDGVDGCQSCNMKTNRFRNDLSAESLSTLTSTDSSIEMRIEARMQPLGRNVNYARRREENLSISNNDRYPFDDSVSDSTSDVSLPHHDRTVDDVWPTAYDLVEDVSMPGSLVTGPWSLSMSDSRSGRVQEFGDARASDPYDTSCSEGGNTSGRDDYDDRPMPRHNFDGSETDDESAGAVPLRSRNY